MKHAIAPLRNIPVRTVVDGVEVTGTIVSLAPNGMAVVIRTPVSGFGTGLHVPWFKMCHTPSHLATEDGHFTARTVREAEWLLKELYNYASSRPSGWGISKVSPDGEWTDVCPAPEGGDRKP